MSSTYMYWYETNSWHHKIQGMGGQFEYWGLWLDSEYGHGECSESCTTFKNYTQLSARKNFEIRNIEVWAVGEKPLSEDVS